MVSCAGMPKDFSDREVQLSSIQDFVDAGSSSPRKFRTFERDHWNMALAAASGKELKLIKIDHRIYPIYMIADCHNDLLLEFNDSNFGICPSKIRLDNRRSYIGPKFSKLRYYYPLPVCEGIRKTNERLGQKVTDIYELLDCILNEREQGYFKKAHLKMARTLIERKAMVV